MYVVPQIDSSKARQVLTRPARPLAGSKFILKVRLFYMPNYIFSVELENRKRLKTFQKICIDALEGNFAFFEDTKLTPNPETPGHSIGVGLSCKKAEKLGLDELHRMVLRQSLKKRDQLSIQKVNYEMLIYYPYWVGFFKRGNGYDFDVIDGLTGQRQGAKMKPVFMKAILANRKK